MVFFVENLKSYTFWKCCNDFSVQCATPLNKYVLDIIDNKYDTNMVSDEGDNDDLGLWIKTFSQSIHW